MFYERILWMMFFSLAHVLALYSGPVSVCIYLYCDAKHFNVKSISFSVFLFLEVDMRGTDEKEQIQIKSTRRRISNLPQVAENWQLLKSSP